jgi:mannosyltransferase OCH1-like enzyme
MIRIIYIIIIFACISIVIGGFYHLYSIPHYIPRKNKSAPREINGVPLVIYQSWQSHIVPKKMKETILNTLNTNPDFDYYLYSDEDSRKFISKYYDSDVVNAFDSLRPGAYKSDLWRYCILYKLGGVYFDIKMVPIVSLYKLISEHTHVFVKDITVPGNLNKEIQNSSMYSRDCVWNGLMISPPNNKIFKYCIDEIVESCKMRLYRNNDLDITGPCLLGRIIKKYDSSNYFKYMILNIDKKNNTAMLLYHNIPYFIVEYPGYRKEQQMFQKSTHYHQAWNNKQVYN